MKNPVLTARGYIEVEINDFTFLHIWDDTLPPTDAKIHDNTFDFTSRIVAGTLIHIAYDFAQNPKGDYHLWGVQPWQDGEETRLRPLAGMRGDIAEFETLTLPKGYQYVFRAGLFHETRHEGFTVTVMTKTRKHVTAAARVAVPEGGSVDNDFRRDDSGLLLTPFVNEAMKYIDQETLTLVVNG